MRKFLLLVSLSILSISFALAQSVSGRLVTSAYIWERPDSTNKSSTYFRGFQTVQLNVGQNDFAVRTYFNVSNDFGTSLTEDPKVRFYNLYLEKKNLFDFADIKAGRIPVFSGMGVGAIDGVALKIHPAGNDLILTGYFGGIMPVDQSLKLIDKMSDNYMMGFQVTTSFIQNASISLSYMNRHRRPESYQAIRLDTIFHQSTVTIENIASAEQYGSLDVYYSKEMMNAYGKIDYDLNNDHLYRGELSLRYNPTNNLGISAEYFHREPRISYNSIFSVFSQENTDEFGGGLDYMILDNYNAFARYSYINYIDNNASRLMLGVNSAIGSLSYSRNFGYVGAQDVVSADFIIPVLERKVLLNAGLNYSSFKFTDDELKNAFALIAGATWRPVRDISVDLQGHLLINEIYKNDFRLFCKFSYGFFHNF